MAVTAKAANESFEQCPTGTHVARCIKVIDLGTRDKDFEGTVSKKREVIIMFEVPSELMSDGKPFAVSRFYTLSLGERANLRRDLESWRGRPFTDEELKGFDIEKLLGVPCMVNVGHNKNGKATILGIMSLPKGITCPPAVNELMVFSFETFDQAKLDKLSDGIKKIVMESDEYKAMAGKTLDEITDDGAEVDGEGCPF